MAGILSTRYCKCSHSQKVYKISPKFIESFGPRCPTAMPAKGARFSGTDI